MQHSLQVRRRTKSVRRATACVFSKVSSDEQAGRMGANETPRVQARTDVCDEVPIEFMRAAGHACVPHLDQRGSGCDVVGGATAAGLGVMAVVFGKLNDVLSGHNAGGFLAGSHPAESVGRCVKAARSSDASVPTDAQEQERC